MIVLPFLTSHLYDLELIEEMGFMGSRLDSEYVEGLASGDATTIIIDGKVACCLGIAEYNDGTGLAWSLMGKQSEGHMTCVTRAALDCIKRCKFDRIEMHVDASFKLANKWADMLGFMLETPNGMKKWGPNGETYNLYARYN